MARVFVTGSSTGLGLMAGELLVEQGHRVVLHARNRPAPTTRAAPCPRPRRSCSATFPPSPARGASPSRPTSSAGSTPSSTTPAVGYREARPTRTEDGLAARLRDQRPRALYPDGADREAGPARLSQLRHAPRRERRPRRYAWTRRAWNAADGLCREQAARRADRLRRRAALAGRAVERARARLGADPHGRRECARRPRPGRIAPRPGSPSATNRKRGSPASISATCASARRTRRRPQSNCRTG